MADVPFIDDCDAALIRRCRAGDAQAWHALVLRYQRLIYTVPRRAGLSEHDAADVFQSCFAALYEHLHALEQPERVQAWLVTTARRETLRSLRRTPRHVRLDTVGGDASDDDVAADVGHMEDDTAVLPADHLAALQAQDRLRRAMQRLDRRSRELLSYLYLLDPPLEYEEIAARLGMAVGSIGPTRARCLAKLRRLWETHE